MKKEMRPSKLIMTFGPGSIIDLPERESYMIMGPDYWKSYDIINEPRLAKKLKVDHFGTPKEKWDEDSKRTVGIAYRDFPFMRVCTECGKLSLFNFYCKDCQKDDKDRKKTMPPRLVAACKAGHIQDFPWKTWCGCKCTPSDSRLYLLGENIEAEGSDLKIKCDVCKAERDLIGALDELRYDCRGERPWLGDQEPCTNKLRGMMRGASNVFFPSIESSISIPPYSTEIHKDLKNHIGGARANWANNKIIDYIHSNFELQKSIRDGKYTEVDLVRAFDEIFDVPSSDHIKGDEWDRLLHDVRYSSNDDFITRKLDITGTELNKYFDKIVQVLKLREVVAIKGFTRIGPYDPDDPNSPTMQYLRMNKENWSDFVNNKNMEIIPKLDYDAPRDWLPGVELFGEGIFFKFKESLVDQWTKDSIINKRCSDILSQPKQPFKRDGLDTTDNRVILIHTFAHQFIRQISLECGYSMASLRERLYVERNGERDMCGVLIYTASSDSEGTLGGLVAQAKISKTLYNHIQSMIDSIRICSQDPLCGSHDPTKTKNAWGASCHSCSQLPETSCEGLQNKLLDRFTLINNGDLKGYFDVHG